MFGSFALSVIHGLSDSLVVRTSLEKVGSRMRDPFHSEVALLCN